MNFQPKPVHTGAGSAGRFLSLNPGWPFKSPAITKKLNAGLPEFIQSGPLANPKTKS
jgi:hypothetical protein